MEGEVIKEVEKEKTDTFIETPKVEILQKSDKLREKLRKMRPGDRLIVPEGTYEG